jgi:hypothetical protein
MGIESLENAARAAGFAMAADEPTSGVEAAASADNPWRSGTVPLRSEEFHDRQNDQSQSSFSDWVKGMVGASGRGAPA